MKREKQYFKTIDLLPPTSPDKLRQTRTGTKRTLLLKILEWKYEGMKAKCSTQKRKSNSSHQKQNLHLTRGTCP